MEKEEEKQRIELEEKVAKARWEFDGEHSMKNRFAKFLRERNEQVSYNVKGFKYTYYPVETKREHRGTFEDLASLIKKIQEIQDQYRDKVPTASVIKRNDVVRWITTSDREIIFYFGELTAKFDSCGDPSSYFISKLIGELGLPASLTFP